MSKVRLFSCLSLSCALSFNLPDFSTAVSTGFSLSQSGAVAQAQESAKSLRVVILPFQNLTQKQEDAWLGNSFAESLTMGLLQVRSLQVIERAQVANVLKEQQFAQSAYVAEETAPRLGKLLGAKVVIMGSYQKVGGQLQANVRFVNAETGQVDAQRYARVQGAFDRLFDLQNELAEQLIQQLNVKAQAQELKQVKQVLKATESTDAYRYYLEARELARKGNILQHDKVIKAYRKALVEDPNYALAYAGLCELYVTQAEKQKRMKVRPPQTGESPLELARFNGNKALELNPQQAEVLRALARLDGLENRPEQAKKHIQQALRLKPNDVDSALVFFNILQEQEGLFNTDLEALKKELQSLGTDMNEPWIKFGFAMVAAGNEFTKPQGFQDYSFVKALLLEVQKELPDQPDVPIVLIAVAQAEGNQEALLRHYEEAYAICQEDPLRLASLSNQALMVKGVDDALQMVNRAHAMAPEDFQVQLLRANVLFIAGQRQEAENIYARLEKQSDNNAYIPFLRGVNYYTFQEFERAEADLIRATQLMDRQGTGALGLSFAQFLLSSAYIEQKKFENAQSYLEELRHDPILYGPAYELLAMVYLAQEKVQSALDAYSAYLTAYPELQTLPEKKQQYNAYYLYNELHKNPKNVKLLVQLGSTETQLKHYSIAQKNFAKAQALAPEMPEVYSNWGYLLLEQKDWQGARDKFQRAVELQGDNSKNWYNLGLCQAHLGQKQQAKASFQKVLSLDPEHTNARAQLDLLK